MPLVNLTENGECSNCGQCCCDTICVTKKEVRRIAEWIKENGCRFHPPLKVLGTPKASCPFRNEAERKCEIYPVRPLICRKFKCDMGERKSQRMLGELLHRNGATCCASLNWIFLGDPTINNILHLRPVDREEWLGEKPEMIFLAKDKTIHHK